MSVGEVAKEKFERIGSPQISFTNSESGGRKQFEHQHLIKEGRSVKTCYCFSEILGEYWGNGYRKVEIVRS